MGQKVDGIDLGTRLLDQIDTCLGRVAIVIKDTKYIGVDSRGQNQRKKHGNASHALALVHEVNHPGNRSPGYLLSSRRPTPTGKPSMKRLLLSIAVALAFAVPTLAADSSDIFISSLVTQAPG